MNLNWHNILAFLCRILFNPKIDVLGIEHWEVGLEICRVAIENYPLEDNYPRSREIFNQQGRQHNMLTKTNVLSLGRI